MWHRISFERLCNFLQSLLMPPCIPLFGSEFRGRICMLDHTSAPRSLLFVPLGAVPFLFCFHFIPVGSPNVLPDRLHQSRRVRWPSAEGRIVVTVVDHALLCI